MEFGFSSDQELSKNFQYSDGSCSPIPALHRAGTVREKRSTRGSRALQGQPPGPCRVPGQPVAGGVRAQPPHAPHPVRPWGAGSAEAWASGHPPGWQRLGCAKAKPT